jgi:hypothetical protein
MRKGFGRANKARRGATLEDLNGAGPPTSDRIVLGTVAPGQVPFRPCRGPLFLVKVSIFDPVRLSGDMNLVQSDGDLPRLAISNKSLA